MNTSALKSGSKAFEIYMIILSAIIIGMVLWLFHDTDNWQEIDESRRVVYERELTP